jgi:hypothetical protein
MFTRLETTLVSVFFLGGFWQVILDFRIECFEAKLTGISLSWGRRAVFFVITRGW